MSDVVLSLRPQTAELLRARDLETQRARVALDFAEQRMLDTLASIYTERGIDASVATAIELTADGGLLVRLPDPDAGT